MTACANCSRALQPAWKYCVYCGTRTAVAAVPPRSRPIPKRTPVPGYVATWTEPTQIVPPAAPAALAAAPQEAPISSAWPEGLGDRPTLKSALASTEIPAPTPPREAAPAPEGESDPLADELEELEDDDDEELGAAGSPSRGAATTSGVLLEATPKVAAPRPKPAKKARAPRDPQAPINSLAIVAVLLGVLGMPFAALFGHLALAQLKGSGERGVIPAWVAVVLGYLWLGFWIVFGITYLATNG
jgi:hypothetical protein